MKKIRIKKIRIAHIECPDWMDKPFAILIPLVYLLFVGCLAILFSHWFWLLLLAFPTIRKDEEKAKYKRLEEWKRTMEDELSKKV